MSKRIQLRRGTSTEHNTFTGANGEVTVDTTNKTLRVHDGTTVGGTALAKVSQLPALASATTLGLIEIATQTEVNAGTDSTRAIVPNTLLGGMKTHLNASGTAPIYACRAWVNFNGVPLNGTYSQAGTTVTVTMTAHGMSVGQNVNLTITSGTAVSGSYTVETVVNANTFTYTAGTNLTTSGNVTRNTFIRASGNVSSITDNGVGDYTVNFTAAMQDINYSVVGSGNLNNGESWSVAAVPNNTMTTSFRVLTKNVGVNGADLLSVNLAVFR